MAQLQNPEPLAQEVQREFEQIRSAHDLRGLTNDESGSGVDRLPGGVFGFTYSPCEDNFPLFAQRDLRSFETHKLGDESVVLLGFMTSDEKRGLEDGQKATLHLFPEPKGEATHLVRLPLSRVLRHVENSGRKATGLEVEIGPAS